MPRRRRRSWPPLLWAGVSFLALQVALGAAVEAHFEAVRDAEYADKEAALLARRAENPGRPLVLVLGSSRTLLGLRAGDVADDAPLVFNFGLQGAGPLRQWVVYQRLRAAGVRPDFVFIEVLPPLFNRTDGLFQEEWWLQGERLTLDEVRRVSAWHSNPSRMLREWLRSRLAPALWHPQDFCRELGLGRLSLRETSSGPEGRCDDHGWLLTPTDQIEADDIQTCTENARRQYANTLRDFRLAEPPARALEELLACCRRDGVPATLFLMPEGTAFRSWCPPGMVAGYEAWLGDLCRRRGVPLVDARRWVEDDGFWDGHHLLPDGAARFTRRWTREALGAVVPPEPGRESRRAVSSLP
jgi:hypothetical protein